MGEKLTTFDPAEDLSSDEAIAVFMEEAFKTADVGYIAHALGVVARAKGMTDEIYADLLRVVSTAGRTNQLLNALQVPVDAAFDAEATAERN